MTAHEVLVAARNLIDREGWVQGALYEPGRGYCALGGINQAKHGAPYGYAGEAFAVLTEVMGGPIVEFNNAPQRTKPEVLAAFDKAIAATAPPPPDVPLSMPERERVSA